MSRMGDASCASAGHNPIPCSTRTEPSAIAEARPSNASAARNAGVSGSTTTLAIPPRAKAKASVRPTKPPPTIATSVSITFDMELYLAEPTGPYQRFRARRHVAETNSGQCREERSNLRAARLRAS